MKKVLLHICCGICSSWCIEKLGKDGYEVIGFFFNPNIQPEEEYKKRLEVARAVAGLFKIQFIETGYYNQPWADLVKGYEAEPEGGRRCRLCYSLRLEKTLNKANELNIELFTTTLSISPHKDSKVINEIGYQVSGEKFLAYSFKKEDGFKKANDFAKAHGFYRQDYCGCLYSRVNRCCSMEKQL